MWGDRNVIKDGGIRRLLPVVIVAVEAVREAASGTPDRDNTVVVGRESSGTKGRANNDVRGEAVLPTLASSSNASGTRGGLPINLLSGDIATNGKERRRGDITGFGVASALAGDSPFVASRGLLASSCVISQSSHNNRVAADEGQHTNGNNTHPQGKATVSNEGQGTRIASSSRAHEVTSPYLMTITKQNLPCAHLRAFRSQHDAGPMKQR